MLSFFRSIKPPPIALCHTATEPYGMQRSSDSILFDGMDLTGMIPLHANEISGRVNKEILLPPQRTQL